MIEKIDAVAADIDMTLTAKGGDLPDYTKEVFHILQDRGVQIGLATGRELNDRLYNQWQQWKMDRPFDFLIGMNGGQVLLSETDAFFEQYALCENTLKEIMMWMKPLGLIASIYEGDHMVATGIDEMQAASMKRNHMEIIDTHGDYDRLCVRPVHTVIYRYFPEQQENVMRHIHDYLSSHPETEYTSVNTFPGIVEIIHKNCNKGEGVKVFAKQSGLEMNQIAGMGDMDNDLGLMTAGIGIALKNGSEKMKAAADFVTEFTCDEDGAGKFLLKHWIEPLGWK